MVGKLAPTIADIDSFVEAFEGSYAREGGADFMRFLPAATHPDYQEIAAELVRVDMELSWGQPRRRRVDDYIRLLPGVLENPDVLTQIAFEEYRLGVQQGEHSTPEDYERRYSISTSGWPSVTPISVGDESNRVQSAEAMEDVWHTADQLAVDALELPEVGERFLDFDLVQELGHGTFARVFLARQRDLAHRPVVLKIASGKSLEAQHLARLQHTHIVPIYSVHSTDTLTAVCMPYFGSRTLADLSKNLDPTSQSPRTGQVFLSTVAVQADDTLLPQRPTFPETPLAPTAESGHGDASYVERIRRMSYVEAVVQIIAQVAEGLAHAHQRGIVHRDLKPANVLLTDDGRAMLLDFNLSEKLVVHGPAALAVGGTLPYMAPEHLRAMLHGGVADSRSDIYAVGVIFFELLTGRQPFPIRRGRFELLIDQMLEDRATPAADVRTLNPGASPAVAATVARCLVADPQDRYQSVDQLHEDLERHLANRPLRYAPNSSLRERVVKWARRHPRLSSAASLAAISVALLASVSWLSLKLWANSVYLEFAANLPTARSALSIPERDPQLIEEGLATVRRSLGEYGVNQPTGWDRPMCYSLLSTDQREHLQIDLGELAYQVASATARLAEQRHESALWQEAVDWNTLAEKLVPDSNRPRAFDLQRAELMTALERTTEAAEARRAAGDRPPQGDLDAILAAQRSLSERRFSEAVPQLLALRDSRPTDPVCWLLLGNAYAGVADYARAAECFSVSAALLPASPWARLNRGLSRVDMREYSPAIEDFDAVLELRPDWPPCLLNRALAEAALGNHTAAIQGFTEALERGATQTRIYFLRAHSYQQIGDSKSAAADLATGLRLAPSDEESWVARGIARLSTDPEGALSDFRSALALNPQSILALTNILHVTADRLNRTDEALECLDQIMEIRPDHADALAGRAVLLARQGNRTAALENVQRLLQTSKKPAHLFQAACVLSLTSTKEEEDLSKGAVLLGRAIALEPSLLARAKSDPDLQQLRESPGYKNLLRSIEPLP